METRDEIERLTNELNELYSKNPKAALSITREAYNNIKNLYSNEAAIIRFIKTKTDIVYLIGVFIFIALMAILNIKTNEMYIFGVIFFVGGLCIGLFIDVIGLIFLFSHGGTGLGFMIGPGLQKILTDPIISENPRNIYTYLCIALIILIITVLATFVHNISHTFRSNKMNKVYITLGYAIVILMISLFPSVVPYLIK